MLTKRIFSMFKNNFSIITFLWIIFLETSQKRREIRKMKSEMKKRTRRDDGVGGEGC